MWRGKNKIMHRFADNIIAVDRLTSVFLQAYIRHSLSQRLYTSQLEVFDLKHYRVIRKPKKVFEALRDRSKEPFVFVVSKN